MIKPRSLQKPYTLIFSGDPALHLPTDEKERELALRIARETGAWDALIKAGEKPTLLEVVPIGGAAFAWAGGEQRRRRLSQLETAELMLRLALRDISNFGEHKVKLELLDGHIAATIDIIDALYSIGGTAGREVVSELGTIIMTHALEGVSPKS